MKIDIHMHVNFNGFTPQRIIKYLNRNRFDLCWLLTWEEAVKQAWPQANLSIDDVYETYERYPSRIVPMYAPDPSRDDAVKSLEYWNQRGIRGCAELKSPLNWKDDKTRRLIMAVAELGIPILFHMEESAEMIVPLEYDAAFNTFLVKLIRSNRFYQIPKRIMKFVVENCPWLMEWKKRRTIIFPGYMLDFASLEATLKEFPHVPFIGHGPLFWKHISSSAPAGEPYYPRGAIGEGGLVCRLLERCSNLYADISGGSGFNALSRDPNFTKKFLVEYHDRVLYGTDTCQLGQEHFLNSLHLPKNCLDAIYADNAIRLLKP